MHSGGPGDSFVAFKLPLLPRKRYIVDPLWKVVDAKEYQKIWRLLQAEAVALGFIGFDMEWTTRIIVDEEDTWQAEEAHSLNDNPLPRRRGRRPRNLTGPVATIQLSTTSYSVVVRLLHLCAMLGCAPPEREEVAKILVDPYAPASDSWPGHRNGQRHNSRVDLNMVYAQMVELLGSQRIAKVGVGIHGDQVKLMRDYPAISLAYCVDLATLAEQVLSQIACTDLVVTSDDGNPPSSPASPAALVRTARSLKDMAATYTGRHLVKDMAVITSDWGGCLGALTPLQVGYAASDAEASFDICTALLIQSGFLDVEPPYRVLESRGAALSAVLAASTSQSPVDGGTGSSQEKRVVKSAAASVGVSGYHNGRFDDGEVAASFCPGRSKRYYDNISVYGAEMQLLYTVDEAKANWYVYRKGLAKVIRWRKKGTATGDGGTSHDGDAATDEIEAIQLSFTPNFERFNDAHIRRNVEYFRRPKDNICVVCGQDGALVRFAVVPLMYRRHFPSAYMSHNSYDLLLLCTSCFAKSQVLYERERRKVAEDFGVPLSHLHERERKNYVAQIAALQASVDSLAVTEEGQRDGIESALVPPQLKLRAMNEYLELNQHRDNLDRIFSYAKALSLHYAAVSRSESGAKEILSGMEREGSQLLADYGAVGDKKDTPQSSAVVSVAPSVKRGRHRKSQATPILGIPPERRAMMQDYLATHAPMYPFELTSPEDQLRAFSGVCGPASAEGVFFILTGGLPFDGDVATSGSNSSRSVLTRYWVREHPGLVSLLPPVTRSEEQRQQCHHLSNASHDEPVTEPRTASATPGSSSDQADDSVSVPYVDSHGFLVVKLLLQRYDSSASSASISPTVKAAGELTLKTSDHAVGQFIYRWRRVFLDGMQPRHLPIGWVAEDGIIR